MEKPKGYYIKKRINRPAKLVGLYYNTFFVFVIIAAIILMSCGSNGFVGFIIGALLSAVIYLVLFFVQTKMGPRQMAKIMKDYYTPIVHIKITKSFRKQLR